jgi:predicted secreted Zn-dependent protease
MEEDDDDILYLDEMKDYNLTLSAALTNYSTQWKTDFSTENVDAMAVVAHNEITIRERFPVLEWKE